MDTIASRHGLTTAQLRLANDGVRLDKKNRLRAAGPVLVPLRPGAKPLATAKVETPATPAPVAVAAKATAAPAKATAAPAKASCLPCLADLHSFIMP